MGDPNQDSPNVQENDVLSKTPFIVGLEEEGKKQEAGDLLNLLEEEEEDEDEEDEDLMLERLAASGGVTLAPKSVLQPLPALNLQHPGKWKKDPCVRNNYTYTYI